jgi:hypothetical protein
MNVIDQIESNLPMVDAIPNSGVNIGQRVAEELAFWRDKVETDSEARPRLAAYWENINFGDDWTPSGTPWSAAFISYLLRGSGFVGEPSHYRYTQRVVDNESPGWVAYSIPKNLGKLRLNPGDVLIRARGSGGTPQTPEYYHTHGDLVWRLTNSEAHLVGGNLSNTARVANKIAVDQQGRPMSALSGYKVILKKKKTGAGAMFWLIGLAVGSGIAYWLTKNQKKLGMK